MRKNRALRRAMRLNNEAAKLASCGRLVEATHLLKGAIELLWADVHLSRQERQPTASSGTAEERLTTRCTVRCHGHHFDYNQDEMLYIHDRLFVLSAKLKGCSPEHYDGAIRTLSLYTLFNTALVHHLRGRVFSDEVYLAKAKVIYRRVLRASNDRTNEALLQCLVLNGLADVHHRMGEYDIGTFCMESVSDIAFHSRCFSDGSIIGEAEVKDIHLNRLCIHVRCAAKAA
jgi:hypothetical protein